MMKSKILCACAGVAALALASCSSSKPMALSNLAGKWNISEVNGSSIEGYRQETTPYLGFDVLNGSLTGSTGCNNLMGSFSTSAPAGALTLSQVGSTRMACPDMALEQAIITALNNVTGFKGAGKNTVKLTGTSGQSLLTLKKAVADYSAANLNGSWRITELNGREMTQDADGVPAVTFDTKAGTYSFATGCNLLQGSFVSSYTDIRFEPGVSSMMSCPDMTVEDTVKVLLPRIVSFSRLDDGSFGFYTADNTLVMTIARK